MFIKTSTTNETTWAALKAAVDNGTIAQGDDETEDDDEDY